MKYDFVAVDFETANIMYNSACSMGLAAVKGKEIVETKYYLIKPPTMHFRDINIKLHKITPEDVKNAPTFQELWPEIKDYFLDNLVVAHNAVFDMSVLKACLLEYGMSIPDFNYICSIPISSCACRGQNVGKSLKERTKYFEIELSNHHNALDDAVACANLVIQTLIKTRRNSIKSFCNTYSSLPIKSFKELKPQTFFKSKDNRRVRISEIAATNENIDSNHVFYNKNLVFTGELKSLDRKEAMQKVVNVGGIVKSSVSSKTDYLVVGTQDPSIVGKKGMSTKEQKAYQLKEKGYHIKILTEDDFLNSL